MEIIKLPPVTKKCRRKAQSDRKQYNRLFLRSHQGGLPSNIKQKHAQLWGKNARVKND